MPVDVRRARSRFARPLVFRVFQHYPPRRADQRDSCATIQSELSRREFLVRERSEIIDKHLKLLAGARGFQPGRSGFKIRQTVRDIRLPAKDLEALRGRDNIAVNQRFVVEQQIHRIRGRFSRAIASLRPHAHKPGGVTLQRGVHALPPIDALRGIVFAVRFDRGRLIGNGRGRGRRRRGRARNRLLRAGAFDEPSHDDDRGRRAPSWNRTSPTFRSRLLHRLLPSDILRLFA